MFACFIEICYSSQNTDYTALIHILKYFWTASLELTWLEAYLANNPFSQQIILGFEVFVMHSFE